VMLRLPVSTGSFWNTVLPGLAGRTPWRPSVARLRASRAPERWPWDCWVILTTCDCSHAGHAASGREGSLARASPVRAAIGSSLQVARSAFSAASGNRRFGGTSAQAMVGRQRDARGVWRPHPALLERNQCLTACAWASRPYRHHNLGSSTSRRMRIGSRVGRSILMPSRLPR
jgi:hypothetical protein